MLTAECGGRLLTFSGLTYSKVSPRSGLNGFEVRLVVPEYPLIANVEMYNKRSRLPGGCLIAYQPQNT